MSGNTVTTLPLYVFFTTTESDFSRLEFMFPELFTQVSLPTWLSTARVSQMQLTYSFIHNSESNQVREQ